MPEILGLDDPVVGTASPLIAPETRMAPFVGRFANDPEPEPPPFGFDDEILQPEPLRPALSGRAAMLSAALSSAKAGTRKAFSQETRDTARYIGSRLPFTGAITSTIDNSRAYFAAKRFAADDWDAQDLKSRQRDARTVAEFLARQQRMSEEEKNKDWNRKVFDVVTQIPGFAIEFGMTSGAFTAGKAATEKAAARLLGAGAKRAVAGKVAGYLAGAAAHTAANPQRVGEAISKRLTPIGVELQPGDGGQPPMLDAVLKFNDESLEESVGKGVLDAYIEFASERSGGLLAKLPGAAKLSEFKKYVAQRWLKLNPNSTVADFGKRIAQKAGWNGVLGEVFEERVGDFARGLTGVNKDYGTLGKLASGDPEGFRQLSVEAAAFSIPGVSRFAIQKLANLESFSRKDVADALGVERDSPDVPKTLEARTKLVEEAKVFLARQKKPTITPPVTPDYKSEGRNFPEGPTFEPPLPGPEKTFQRYESPRRPDDIAVGDFVTVAPSRLYTDEADPGTPWRVAWKPDEGKYQLERPNPQREGGIEIRDVGFDDIVGWRPVRPATQSPPTSQQPPPTQAPAGPTQPGLPFGQPTIPFQQPNPSPQSQPQPPGPQLPRPAAQVAERLGFAIKPLRLGPKSRFRGRVKGDGKTVELAQFLIDGADGDQQRAFYGYLAHEMHHHLKRTDAAAWSEIESIVRQHDAAGLEAETRQYIANLRKFNQHKMADATEADPEKLRNEGLSYYIQNRIDNEDFVSRLAGQKPNVFRQILAALKKLLKPLTGKSPVADEILAVWERVAHQRSGAQHDLDFKGAFSSGIPGESAAGAALVDQVWEAVKRGDYRPTVAGLFETTVERGAKAGIVRSRFDVRLIADQANDPQSAADVLNELWRKYQPDQPPAAGAPQPAKPGKPAEPTPMMNRWLDLKAQNPGSIVLFRMGDFYETFFEDAEIAAKTLGLTLASRDKSSANPVPMAGFPYHQLDAYLQKLVHEGHRVAIADFAASPAAGSEKRPKSKQPAEPSPVAALPDRPAVVGKETVVEAPGIDPIPARYAVMELADLTPSHDFTGGKPKPSAGYPTGLQPRDYAPKSAEAAKVERFAQEAKTAYYLSTHPAADSGPPTVTPNGIVINGNGRAMSLQAMRRAGTFSKYRDALVSQLSNFGIDANAVEGMKSPVLVRIVDLKADSSAAARFARAGNVSTTQAQSPVRTAASLAGLIDESLIDSIHLEADTTFSEAVTNGGNAKKFRTALEDAIPSEQRSLYFNDDGTLTDSGTELVRHMLLTKVFPVDLVERLGADRRQLKRTLEGSIPQLMKIRRDYPEANVVPQLVEALRFIIRNPDVKTVGHVDDTLAQGSLFGGKREGITPGGRMMLDFLMNEGGHPRRFRDKMTRLARDLSQGSGLFASDLPDVATMAAEVLDVARRPGAEFGDAAAGVDFAGHPSAFDPIPVSLEPGGDSISNHEIIATLEREFDVPIRTGRVPGQPSGIYKRKPQLVRLKSRVGGDLGVATHEVAHHLDRTQGLRKGISEAALVELQNLDYDQNERRPSEGIAEFIRLYLTYDGVAEQIAPNYYRHFTETWRPAHPDHAAKLDKVKSLIDRWKTQGAGERIQANISQTGKPARPVDVPRMTWLREQVTQWGHRAYAALKDEGHFLNLFTKEAEAKGLSVAAGESPFDLYRAFTQSGPTFAESAIENGVFTMTDMQRIGPSLQDVFAEIDPAEYDTFVSWLVARHTIEVHSQGGKTGIRSDDAVHWYKQHANPRYEKAARRFTEFNNAMIDMLADAGVITERSATAMKEKWKTYIPLQRVRDTVGRKGGLRGKKLLNLPEPLKRRKGADLQIIDPIQATVERAVRFYERAAQQQVIEATIKAAMDTKGMGGWIDRVPPNVFKTNIPLQEVWPQIREKLEEAGIEPEMLEDVDTAEVLSIWQPNFFHHGDQPVARVVRNGQSELYEFDKDLFAAINGMNFFQLPYFLEITFGGATRLVKLGATGLSLAFSGRNVIRDYGAYLAQKQHAGDDVRGLVGPADMIKTYIYSEVQKLAGNKSDPVVRLWQEMGGELSQTLGLDRRRIKSGVARVVDNSTQAKLLNIVKHPIDAARKAIGITEVGPRLAEFRAVLEKHGFDRQTLDTLTENGQRPPRHVLVEAINAANDVTVNFKRQGWVGKRLNRIIPFFNANLEGMDKFVRTFRDNPKRAFIVSAMMASGTVAYWMMVKDDDWYEEAPAWQKYGFWTMTDGHGAPAVRIPRPHGWGTLIGSGTEAILDTTHKRDPKALKEFSKHAADSSLPSLKPALVSPAVEAYFNYDTFRNRPIVSEQLSKLRPVDQHTAYNTLLARKAAAWIGELPGKPGVSPAKLEHWAEGQTGGLFRAVVKPSEMVTFGSEFTTADVPGVGGFAFRKDFSVSVEEFYKALRQTEQEYNSARERGKVPDSLAEKNRKLHEAARWIRKIRDQVKDVADRDVRFQREKYIIGIARHVLGKPEMERYPNPLPDRSAPPDVRNVFAADNQIRAKAATLARKPPLVTEIRREALAKGVLPSVYVQQKRRELEAEKKAAVRWLQDRGLRLDDLKRAYRSNVRGNEYRVEKTWDAQQGGK